MANYAILRIEKRKAASVTPINNHHERLKEKYKSNEDIDPERTHLNYHLVEPEGKYREKALERIEEVGAKRRKDSVVLQDVLITASPDWIDAKSYEEQVEYFDHAFNFISDRYGRENILSAVVHMDEAHPHMHLVFVPITPEGKLSSKTLMGGPKGMEKLQDDFHEHMVKKYPDLTRGISKKITKRRHISSQMYKQAAALYEHYDQILDAINAIGMIGNAKAKEDAIELLGRYAPDLAKVKEQLNSTQKYIEVLEGRLSYSDSVIQGKNAELDAKDLALYEERSKVMQLEYKQKKLIQLLEKIPPEMRDELLNGKKPKERDVR
ncbi:Plasmid recombination enzyme [Eubacterium pyruvativorans]|uniref:Plasmid recombination enzyme n=1 Tax=Eubacterium pyruvativorans TaxID=155865 RepID=A0A1I7IJR9_9FIRM|nr:MobV family relaxase [Eubacterium pyruvativorans]SFO42155.1 Plasmid recombination enzyme [Eubacterium pyruvativorans]SFU73181.1 Plasmid recombination enzyme [Eubacterium pyruvativorans]